jgi:uncharacterized protein
MLHEIADWLVIRVFHLDPHAAWGAVIHFFIYDSFKIILLVFAMISTVGFLRSFLPQSKVKTWINRQGIWGHMVAALFGAITPFCSCSSIPIFLGFLKSGVPLGVNFSFLITSPLINEYLVVLMLGFFGWKITFFYILSGLLIGIITGMILGQWNLEEDIVEDFQPDANGEEKDLVFPTFATRLAFGLREAVTIIKKIWWWIIIGVGIGAMIHNFIPEQAIQSVISKTGPFSVPLAVLIGVPIYGNCVAIVPIAVALFHKGIPLGTALSFMMATAALSLPEAILLRRAMKLKLIAIFFGVTSLAIVFTGYLINFLQPLLTK